MILIEKIICQVNNELVYLNLKKGGKYSFMHTRTCHTDESKINILGKETTLKLVNEDIVKNFRVTTDYPDMAKWNNGFRVGIQNMDDKTAKIKNHCDYLIKYKLLGDNKFYLDYHEEHLADHFLNWLDPSHKIASIKE